MELEEPDAIDGGPSGPAEVVVGDEVQSWECDAGSPD